MGMEGQDARLLTVGRHAGWRVTAVVDLKRGITHYKRYIQGL